MRNLSFSARKWLKPMSRAIIATACAFGAANAVAASPTWDQAPAAQPDEINNIGFALDPAFNGGQYFQDRFAGPDTSDYRGRKIARLSNGDLVAVGLVPNFQQGNSADGFHHIGIVRYRQNGERVAWTYSPNYGQYGNNYLIYPGNVTSGQLSPRFSAVKDVVVYDNTIYILADHTPVGGNRNVHLLIFSDVGADSGRFLGHYSMFASASNEEGGSLLAHAGGAVGSSPKLVVTGTVYSGSGTYISALRLNIPAGGSITFDSTFGTSGIADIYLTRDASNPNRCAAQVTVANRCPIVARSLAAGYRGILNVGAYYIGADRLYSDTSFEDWDAAVIKLNSNGTLDTSFGQTGNGPGGGFAFNHFDFGIKDDRNRALAVRTLTSGGTVPTYSDEIYNVMYVSQSCAGGASVAKLNAAGAYVATFANSGRLRFGGWNDPSNTVGCATIGSTQARGATISGGKLFIVGEDDAPTAFDTARAPMIASVDLDSGALLQRSTTLVPVSPPYVSYNGSLYDVVSLGDDRFGVVGDTTGLTNGSRFLFITGIFGRDLIFANGFD
jgi:hypothetical protein